MNMLTSARKKRTAHGQWRTTLLRGLGAVAGAAAISYLILTGNIRLAITLTVATILTTLAIVRIQTAVLATLVYLVFMGDLRRLLIPLVGWAATDPLLMIAPAFTIVLFGYAVASGSVRLDTKLAWGTAALMVIMILQIFNPRQGGLMVGVAGALFYLIPLLWFWIGRTFATPRFMKTLLFKVLIILAVLAAAMGLYQTFFGYLPYQLQWYNIAGYTSLGSKGIQAPISFFSSSISYAVFLLVAVVVLLAQVFHRKQYTVLPVVILLFVAAFLQGSRGPVAMLLVVTTILWAVLGQSKKTWILRGSFALFLGIVALGWSLSNVSVSGAGERVQYRVQRQVTGLTSMTDPGSSASNHLGMMVHGIILGIKTPLGAGLGSTTKAAAKFGAGGGSTEVDISNIFVSTGLIGGFIYLAMIFLIVRATFQYWIRTRSLLALAILGLLALTGLTWLNGGRYALTAIIWLCIGGLDRFQNVEHRKQIVDQP